MTIAKGENWGSLAPRPIGLRTATDDADLALMLTDGTSLPTAVAAGDLFRTIGARPLGDRDELLVLPIDIMRVTIGDDAPLPAVAHVIAHRPLMLGGWLRGSVLAVMNAEFVGDYDVAPRGHPNDGRVESLLASAELPIRQRLAVRKRMPTAAHLPHPQIETRSIRQGSWEFAHDVVVRVDGIGRGRTRRVAIEVVPDAAVVHA